MGQSRPGNLSHVFHLQYASVFLCELLTNRAVFAQASGAYIFRPNCTEDTTIPCKPFLVNTGAVSLTVTSQPGVQEVLMCVDVDDQGFELQIRL